MMKAHECDPSNLSDVSIQNSNEHCCEQNPSADTAIVAILVANVYVHLSGESYTWNVVTTSTACSIRCSLFWFTPALDISFRNPSSNQ